jgi:hypothetical protein
MTGRPRYGGTPGRRGGARRVGVAADPAAVLESRIVAADRQYGPLGWTETQFQRAITDYVDELDAGLQLQYPGVPGMRMLWHHETDSRKTRAGWLDLFIAGPSGQLVPELKTEARRTRVTPEQRLWLDVLAYGGAAAFVWTPADWVAGAIQNELRRLARPRRTPAPVRVPAPESHGCGCPKGQRHVCETWGGLFDG